MARYCPLFSGSSGNCTYVGTADGGVLVDAGVSAKRIETALREREIDPASVRAVLVTHEHRDHVAGLRVLLKRFHYPVYASRGTWQSLQRDGILGEGDLGAMLDEMACLTRDLLVLKTAGNAGITMLSGVASDKEALELFNWFKELTLKDTQRVYDLLGVTFDSYNGEAFFNDKMGRVIEELKAKNLLTISDGASIVDLDEEKTGMPPCLILKKDGATLYATRDIAAALWRKDEYDFYKCLYIVAYQQDLHFRQWFKVVEKMGYEWAKDLVHVAFGMISYEGQSLSTRKGHVVFLEDLLLNAIQKARAIIEEKSPDLDNKDEVARQVGIGAVIYADLQNNRIKDIDFSWERALSFDGETGPYVQYTHARCCSALRKAEGLPPAEPDYAALSDDFAQELLRQLSRFPETVREAAARYEPSIVTRAVTELCKAYNKFYYENRILEEDAGVREARVRLTRAVRDTIRTGLWLIGMEAPERM